MAYQEEYIKEYSGKIIGIIETEPNGNKTALLYNGRKIVGFYKKAQDWTTDFFGHVVSKGDNVVSLIYENYNK